MYYKTNHNMFILLIFILSYNLYKIHLHDKRSQMHIPGCHFCFKGTFLDSFVGWWRSDCLKRSMCISSWWVIPMRTLTGCSAGRVNKISLRGCIIEKHHQNWKIVTSFPSPRHPPLPHYPNLFTPFIKMVNSQHQM